MSVEQSLDISDSKLSSFTVLASLVKTGKLKLLSSVVLTGVSVVATSSSWRNSEHNSAAAAAVNELDPCVLGLAGFYHFCH